MNSAPPQIRQQICIDDSSRLLFKADFLIKKKKKTAFPTVLRCKTTLFNIIKCILTRADIWFDDVDPKDIEAAIGPEAAEVARRKLGLPTGRSEQSVERVLVKEKSSDG